VRIYTGTVFDISVTLLRPLLSAGAMGGVAAVVYHVCADAAGNLVGVAASILAGLVVYVVMLFATGSIKPEELRLLPRGDPLYKLYRKFRPKK